MLDCLQAAISGADLVIHAAGPFQRKKSWAVLEAAIELKVPYVDVCDDEDYAYQAKEYHQKAVDAGVPCIISAGIYPGEFPGTCSCALPCCSCVQLGYNYIFLSMNMALSLYTIYCHSRSPVIVRH